jgi:hypothetical protein
MAGGWKAGSSNGTNHYDAMMMMIDLAKSQVFSVDVSLLILAISCTARSW